jgi:hypothetical protein
MVRDTAEGPERAKRSILPDAIRVRDLHGSSPPNRVIMQEDAGVPVLLVHPGGPQGRAWAASVRTALGRFDHRVQLRELERIPSVSSLVRGEGACLFVLGTPNDDVSADWRRSFDQHATDTQLLRLAALDGDTEATLDAILCDAERIAGRVRRGPAGDSGVEGTSTSPLIDTA